MVSPDVSVVIPMFNEGENVTYVVPPLVSSLRSAGVSFEIVLVDNGSRDDTAQRIAALAAADPAIRTVTVPENIGYGHGVLCGISAGRGRHIAYMSGDGQIRAEDAVKIIEVALRQRLPFVKATRHVRNDGLTRRIMTVVYNALLRMQFGTPTWDANGTPKVLDAAVLRRVALSSKDQFLDAELVIKMTRLGIRPVEVPVVFYPRVTGRSKVSAGTMLEFLRNIFVSRRRLDYLGGGPGS